MLSCLFRIRTPIVGLVLLVPAATARAQILPQATAKILVESSNGAEVYLDENRIGVVSSAGSLVIPNVSPGPHRVKVVLKGKHDFEQRLVATAGEVKRIRAVLTNQVGNLELYTARGATVEVDGQKVGTADDTGRILIRDLKAGPRNLRILEEGYNERKEEVQIGSDQTLTITLDLDAAVLPATASGTLPTFAAVRTLAAFSFYNVISLAFSPDSKWVMAGNSAGNSYVLRIWETSTGREVRAQYDDNSSVYFIACPHNVTWCGSGHGWHGPAVRIWDAKTGKELHRFEDGLLTSISRDGKRLAVSRSLDAGVGETTVFDTSAWQPLFKLTEEKGTLDPEARLLVTTKGSIQFWDALTGKKLPTSIVGQGDDARFSPDGRWLAVRSKGQLQIWEIDTGRMGARFGVPEDPIFFAVFSPDGRLLVTQSSRDEVTIWDFALAKSLQKLGRGTAIGVSPDGEWIAVGGDGITAPSVRLWQKRPSPR